MDIIEKLQAVICDPLYNFLRIVELSSTVHDFLSHQDVIQFWEALSTLTYVKALGLLLFSFRPFRTWYELLLGEVKGLVKWW